MRSATAFPYISTIAIAIAHLAGLVIAAILLSRRKGTAALLAVIAFALLVLLDAGQIVNLALIPRLFPRLPGGARSTPWLSGGLNCCCGLLDLTAVGCLIAAIWLGLGGPGTRVEPGAEGPSKEATSG